MTTDTTPTPSDYDRGFEYGTSLKAIRDAGDGSYDPRFDFADEARSNRGGFDEFMRGVNAAFGEDGR